MAKVTLTDLTTLANDTSAVNSINDNFQALEDYINDKVLSRDTGAEVNTLLNDIDFNGYDILNLTEINGFSVTDITAGLVAQVGYAEEWAQKAEDSLVSVAAGGNGTTEYSAFHYAQKAAASASAASVDSGLAATSASDASAAQTAAEAAQTAAETALDTFDDIFLGVKASEPTLDNDGNALQAGALYFNSTSDTLWVYDGATWQQAAFDVGTALFAADIGVTVQGYDADTTKNDVANTFTQDQTFGAAVNETVFAVTGTTPALDPTNGTIQTWSISGASTPTENFSSGQSMTLMVVDSGSAGVTWPTITWVGGTEPTLATTGYSVISLWKVSTTLYGASVGDVA